MRKFISRLLFGGKAEPPDVSAAYACLNSKEAKSAALAGARVVGELDAMWAAWEREGYSREGLLYAEVLLRKRELGASLKQEDINRVHQADMLWKRAKDLPTIYGRGR